MWLPCFVIRSSPARTLRACLFPPSHQAQVVCKATGSRRRQASIRCLRNPGDASQTADNYWPSGMASIQPSDPHEFFHAVTNCPPLILNADQLEDISNEQGPEGRPGRKEEDSSKKRQKLDEKASRGCAPALWGTADISDDPCQSPSHAPSHVTCAGLLLCSCLCSHHDTHAPALCLLPLTGACCTFAEDLIRRRQLAMRSAVQAMKLMGVKPKISTPSARKTTVFPAFGHASNMPLHLWARSSQYLSVHVCLASHARVCTSVSLSLRASR